MAYDAKVVPIWDGFQRWFASQGLAFDYVLYSNYERQVAALLDRLIDLPPGARVACVLSGGNLNLDQLRGLRWN